MSSWYEEKYVKVGHTFITVCSVMAASNADGRGCSIKNSVVLEINYIAYVGRRPSSSMGICQ